MENWIKVAKRTDFVSNGGGCVQHKDLQIAVFNFDYTQWYAVQNKCPHSQQMVLSRGLIGDVNQRPMVACPLHKCQFCLASGDYLGGHDDYKLTTYPIKEEDGFIYLGV